MNPHAKLPRGVKGMVLLLCVGPGDCAPASATASIDREPSGDQAAVLAAYGKLH